MVKLPIFLQQMLEQKRKFQTNEKPFANPLDITVNEALQIYIDRNDFRPKQLGSTVSTLIYIWGGATKSFSRYLSKKYWIDLLRYQK